MAEDRTNNSNWQLAELNLAWLVAPIDSPHLKSFVDQLDTINGLAEQSPGFVWRWIDENGNPSNGGFDDDLIVNISVWDDIDSLFEFTYKNAHSTVMPDRKQWFKSMAEASMVLWWVPAGHQPSPEESRQRLQLLQSLGPSADAFTFKSRFDAPAEVVLSKA